ncbi:MAG TPA: hypothetical protein ENJ00_04335 [Phycisphaerales bacterium]|nr:hypothetical protein [Phycisphaerales bacterium]
MIPGHRLTGPLRWFRGVLFGAVLQRELRSSGRRRSTYIVRGGYVALFALGVLMVLASFIRDYDLVSMTERSQVLTMIAEEIVLFLTWFQFLLISAIAPALTSSTICEERRARTLLTLVSTPLSATQIIVGKLSARLYQIIVLVLVSVPLLLVLRIFGGIPTETIIAFTVLTLGVGLLGGSLGLLFSMWHTKAAPAAIFALISLALLFFTPPILYAALRRFDYFGLSGAAIDFFAPIGMATCPPLVLMHVTEGGITHTGLPLLTGTVFDKIWVDSLIYLLVISMVMILLAVRTFRSIVLDETIGKPPAENATTTRRSRKDSIKKLRNRPILWREAKLPFIGNRFYLAILCIVGGAGLVLAYTSTDFDDPTLHILISFVALIVLTLIAAVQTTSDIGAEREAGSWDVLLTTPISGGQIILQKYIAALRRIWPFVALLTAHFVLAMVLGSISILNAIEIIVLVISPSLLYLATGLMFSLVVRRTILASILNVSLVSLWWVILPILTAIMFLDMVGTNSAADNMVQFSIHIFNPLMMLATAVGYDQFYSPFGSTRNYDVGNQTVGSNTFALYVFLHVGIQILMAIAALRISMVYFNRFAPRTS